MTPGTLLLLVAFLGGVTATATLAYGYLRDVDEYVRWAELGMATLSLGLVVSLTYLTYLFATTDYTNAYVWENTADYLPLLYRLTGVYAGNEGSILLWGTIASVVALWAAVNRGLGERSTKLVQAIVVGFVTYLAGILLLESPFAPVWTATSSVPPGVVPQTGTGINPLLVDPFMAIHPPIMFTGYALVTMPFAIGVAHFVSLLRGDGGIFERWTVPVTRWLRTAWLFLTAAVALGAFWSYTVLGWGGLWLWDPVETAIFIPWLFLTGTLHAAKNYRSGRGYSVLAPAMTATTLALAVYTTTVVRSDVFRSVHSFASGGIDVSLILLMALTLGLGVGLPFVHWLRVDGTSATPERWLSRSTLMHGVVLVFGILTFVSIWGLTFPVLRDATTGIQVAVDARYYNLWSFPFVVVGLLLLGFYMDYDVEGRRRSLVALGVVGVVTVVAAGFPPSPAWELGTVHAGDALFYRVMAHVSALAVVPPVVYVVVAVGKRGYRRVRTVTGTAARRKEVGITLIHVSAALLVFSLPFTYLFVAKASVVAGAAAASTSDVPDSNYSVQVLGRNNRQIPSDPPVSSYATSSDQVLARGASANRTAATVYGTVTDVRRGPNATVLQLDDSGLWVGVTGQGGQAVQRRTGQTIVARGVVMWNFVPQTDAVLLANPSDVGTPASPPKSADPTRVRISTLDLAVYRGDALVASGTAGQRTYVDRSGLITRDVVVDRGLLADTYVIASLDDGPATITIKRIPFVTPIRASVVGLLLGMALVLAYDPRYGLLAARDDTGQPADSDAATPSD